MKSIFRINSTFTKVEFWAANTIFAFILFFFLIHSFQVDDALESFQPRLNFDGAGMKFDFYRHYFWPNLIQNIVIFLALLFVNFIVIPSLILKHRVVTNIVFLIMVFNLVGIVFAVTDTYLKEYLYNGPGTRNSITRDIYKSGYINAVVTFALLGAYTILKYIGVWLIDIASVIQSRYSFLRREGTVGAVIWAIGVLFLLIANPPYLITIGWIMAIPSAILLYLAGFQLLIPASLNSKRPFLSYAFKNAVILFIVLMAWGLILKVVIGGDRADLAALWIFNSVLQMCITVPVTWTLYKRHQKGNEQINVLKKELGQSTASFDFLRSQINPHFLFNALNTLYGTAIQEKAERTSEGIEKLGNMMRFMLRENMQEKISLSREVDYLKNYISLQKLRTDTIPAINIETSIQETDSLLQIAPMLLIPFVENSFKHGISLREPSHIKVNLEVKETTLHLQVYNSRHTRSNNDPEKDKSGIGLENVRQRLNLLYPDKHKLTIRDGAKEYIIYLTLQLA